MFWTPVFAGVTLAVTFYGSIKTAASEYSSIRAQIRTAKETSLIVNGGHYMTRGHVIVRMLYIKDVPDVKNYFGTGR